MSKKAMRNTKIIIWGLATIFLYCLFLAVYKSCVQTGDFALLEKMKQLEIGMTEAQVVEIVGQPANRIEFSIDGISYIELLFPAPFINSSTSPSVLICKETGFVIRITIDDLEQNTRRAKNHELCPGFPFEIDKQN